MFSPSFRYSSLTVSGASRVLPHPTDLRSSAHFPAIFCPASRSFLPSKDFLENFVPSHPRCAFGGTTVPCTCRQRSSRFSPPHRCRLSSAGTFSLLRTHLPPAATSIRLDSHLAFLYLCTRSQQASPVTVRAPCEQSHPQAHCRSDQVLGFALFCTLTYLHCRIRFAFAMYCSLPIASFRPLRCR